MTDKLDFLKRVFFFRNLSEKELHHVLQACNEEIYEPGDIIFSEGSSADRFFILMEGRVEVWKDYFEKRPDLLGQHNPGHFFGEMALLDGLPRSATVVAKDRVSVLFLYRDDFRNLVVEHSAIALSVMTSLSYLIRSTNEVFVDDMRKRTDELERANRELKDFHTIRLRNERLSTLGKFSSMILHDIRNPISTIRNQLTLIRMDPANADRVEKAAAAAEAETVKLERLANEFLDYSRGDIKLDMTVVEPARLITAVVNNITARLEHEKIRLSVSTMASGRALFDYDRMQRVILNLVDNARKALLDVDASRRSLKLSSRYQADVLIFEVEDSGTGMTAEVREHLYEPFYSASGRGGTGLGLLIVKNIVEAHGGSLQVRSEPGQGSIFSVQIPRRL